MKKLLCFFCASSKKLAFLFLIFYTANAFSQNGSVPELIYYKFNTAGTTVVNEASSPVGVNPAPITGLTIGSGGMLGTNGLVGTGASSSTNVINTGWNTQFTGDFTIAFWTSNVPSSSTLYYIFGDNGASGFRCFTNGVAQAGNWMLRGPFPDITITGAATSASNMIHVVYDASALTLTGYLDGVQVAQVAVPSALNTTGSGLTIGGYSSSAGLAGVLDEFRWYNRALSAQEIGMTYDAELPLSNGMNNAGVASIDSVQAICPGLQDIYATIQNYGSNLIDSVEVYWEVNGVPQTMVHYKQPLDTFNGTLPYQTGLLLGSANIVAGNNSIKVWTSMPNGVVDTVNSNDTAFFNVFSPSDPTGLDFSNITSTSVDANVIGLAGSVEYEYGTTGFVLGNGTSGNSAANQFSLTGLTSNTVYDVYIRNDCGGGVFSGWSGPYSFKTLCSPYTAPYFNNFENEALDVPPSCWEAKATYSAAWVEVENFTGTAAPYSGSQALYLYGSSGDPVSDTVMAISPDFTDLVASNKQIRFFANSDDPASQLIVGTMPHPFSTTLNVIDTITLQVPDVYQEVIVIFDTADGYNGTDQFIYLRHSLGDPSDYIRIDEFNYELVPSCRKPNNLNVSNITTTGAELSWTEENVATEWEIEYGLENFVFGNGNRSVTLTNPVTISGLNPGTTYEFYVRSLCGRGDTSIWQGPLAFNTAFGVPFFQDFENFGSNTAGIDNVEGWNNTAPSAPEWESGTSTSSVSTGPSGDHTTGNGTFMYLETSGGSLGDLDSLISPPIYIDTNLNGLALDFWYHMYGSTMGDLEVYVLSNGISQLLTTISGQQHSSETDPWIQHQEILTGYTGSSIRLIFKGIRGSNYYSDMSIDDVSITELQPNNAKIAKIVSPSGSICPGTLTPTVEVANFGGNTINTLDVIYSVNGVYDTIPITTAIPVGQTQTIALNPVTFLAGVNYNIEFYTSNPNGVMDTDPSDDTLSIQQKTGLVGNYTIDPSLAASSTNYTNFTSAVDDLNAYGLCGPVNFDVAAGVYNEEIVLGSILASSQSNTITFDGNDSSMVKLIGSGVNPATIILDGTNNLVIKNMTIENTGTTNAAVLFGPGSNYNEISNSLLRVAKSTTSSSIVVAFSGNTTSTTTTGGDASYNLIQNNRIVNGYYGIRMYGATAGPHVENRILNNDFDSSYYYGIYAYYTDYLEVIGNNIDAYTQGNINADGAYIYYSVNSKVNGNQIHANDYGLYVYSYNIPSASTFSRNYEIINNMVISEGDYGIYTYYLDVVDIYHNTVVVRGSTPALQIYATASNSSTANVRNNILIAGSGPALRTNEPTASMILGMDHNIYYTTGTELVDLDGTGYADLPALQTALPAYNINSIEGLPMFTGVNDLHVVDIMVNNKGDNSVGVTVDIDGDPRPIGNDLVVDIGADEFEMFGDDAGVTAIVSPAGRICPGTITMGVEVTNFGINDIDSVQVVSVINGVYDTVKYNTTIPLGQTATVFLNPYTFLSSISYDIQIYTIIPNGVNDKVSTNDTLVLTNMLTGLIGNYTIDTSLPASLTNYHTFAEAAIAMTANGVCGPVTFTVAAGTYNEAVYIGEIDGTSSVNTVTFDGINASAVKLLNNGNSVATVILDGTDHLIIKNMSIENTGTTNAAVLLAPGSNHNEVSNSVLRVAPSTTSSSIPLVFSGSAASTTTTGGNASYNLIKDNHIINGYYGIKMYGASADPLVNNRIIGNDIDSTYYYGVYAYYTDSLEVIGNNIDAVTANNTNADGVYMLYPVNSKVNGNQVHANDYGIYLSASTTPSASNFERRYEIINNMVISEGDYGIYTYYLDTVNIYHNTVEVRGTTPALQLYATASNSSMVDVRNNILIAGSGPALRTNEPNSSMILEMDHNIYYTTGTELVDLDGTGYANLPALQTAVPAYNINSIEGLPIFMGVNDLHVVGPLPNNAGDNSVGVTIDIDGETRPIGNDTIVDIGADEFEISANDVNILSLVQPINSVNKCYTNSENVEINFNNFGLDSLDFTVDSVTITVDVTGAVSQTLTTVVNNNSMNNGGMLAPLDTLSVPVGVVDMSAIGTYYFNITLSMATDDNLANNQMMDSITVEAPFGGTVIGQDTICSGDTVTISVENSIGGVQWQSATAGVFTDIPGATSLEIQVSPTTNTSYRVVACGTSYSDTMLIESILLNQPIALDSTVVINCGGTDTVALVATSTNPNAIFEWYNVPTGGTALTAGGNIVSISPNGDTLYYQGSPADTSSPSVHTFYVQEVTSNGSAQYLGPLDINIGAYATWTSTAQDLLFEVYKKTTIKTVDIFFNGSVNSAFEIVIVDETTNNVVHTYNGVVTVSSTTTAQTVPIEATLPPGDYSMNFSSSGNPGVYRNSSGAVYPYSIPGQIAITGNTFDPAYYYIFYNWQIGGGCVSSRDTAVATINCIVGLDEKSTSLENISIHPNPSKGVFNIVGNNVEEAVEISIFNSNGKLVYQSNDKFSNNFEEQIDISNLSKGLYFVKLQSGSSMEMKKIVVQ